MTRLEDLARFLCEDAGYRPDDPVPYQVLSSGLHVQREQPKYDTPLYPEMPRWRWSYEDQARTVLGHLGLNPDSSCYRLANSVANAVDPGHGKVKYLGCSRPCLDGFGDSAHALDLDRRETVAWLDREHPRAEQLAVREATPLQAEALLQAAAAAQGWTPATQTGVLLAFIDSLIAPDPGVAHRLQAHLAAVSAEPEAMLCAECGEPMFLTVEGTSHHAGDGMDGIDHGRDRDHTAIADEES